MNGGHVSARELLLSRIVEMRRCWWLAVVLSAACDVDPRSQLPVECQDGGCPPEQSTTWLFQQAINRDLDVLFVLDDSPAFAARAAALADDYRRAAAILGPETWTPAPALHVAFMGGGPPYAADSKRAAACGIAGPEPYLATLPCGRSPNSSLPVAETFACMAAPGAADAASFTPLAALRRALDPAGPALGLNGFLRPSAYLQLVIVAGQDDASTVDLAEVRESLRGLKVDPNKVLVSVAGPLPENAPRLKALVDAFGANGVYANVDEDRAVSRAFSGLRTGSYDFGAPCVGGVLDTDPAREGLQADCIVEDHPEDGRAVILPSCERAGPPCWRLTAERACRPGDLVFTVDRGPDWCPEGFSTTVTCRTQP